MTSGTSSQSATASGKVNTGTDLSGTGTIDGKVRLGSTDFPFEQDVEISDSSVRVNIDFDKVEVGDSVTLTTKMRVGGIGVESTVSGEVVPGGTPGSFSISRSLGIRPTGPPALTTTGGQNGIPSRGIRFSYDFRVTIGSQSTRIRSSGTLLRPRFK